MIDSHCHLNFEAFADDYQQVVGRAKAAGVEALVVPSTQIATSRRAIELAREFPGVVFPAVGFHPTHVGRHEFRVEDYRALVVSAPSTRGVVPVVAIGEIGLDAHRPEAKAMLDRQQEVLRAQLELALELDLPVILHCRDAYEELLELLRALPAQPRGVLHCCMAGSGLAQQFLDLGYSLGFTGVITYPKNSWLREIARTMPLDRILVETDAPFLPPQSHRGTRNEPSYLPEIASTIARARGIGPEEIVTATTTNTRALFGI